MSQSNTRLARVRTARRPHVSRASANARGRGVARIVVVGSELEFEPRLATSPLATAADAAPVRNHRTRIRRGLFCQKARAPADHNGHAGPTPAVGGRWGAE